MSYTWNLSDGIELKVFRVWHNTTTYLSYKQLRNYKKQQAEIKRQKEQRKAKEYKS